MKIIAAKYDYVRFHIIGGFDIGCGRGLDKVWGWFSKYTDYGFSGSPKHSTIWNKTGDESLHLYIFIYIIHIYIYYILLQSILKLSLADCWKTKIINTLII